MMGEEEVMTDAEQKIALKIWIKTITTIPLGLATAEIYGLSTEII
jgi:hypothetical protein